MKQGEFTWVDLEGGITTCAGFFTAPGVDGTKHDHDGNETIYHGSCERCGVMTISIKPENMIVIFQDGHDGIELPPPPLCWCGWPHFEPELKALGTGPFMVGEVEGVSIVNTRALKGPEDAENVTVQCRNPDCDATFVTSTDEPGKCWKCGSPRELKSV